ncbi:MAG: 50S ribosomal protein L34 [Opitutales bacterium]|jgi:large subunit ribosomal protein L34
MQPTYRPSKIRRIRKFGFRARMATKGGRNNINARRARGRKRLAATVTN